jgi:hypothetical protein
MEVALLIRFKWLYMEVQLVVEAWLQTTFIYWT